MAPQSNVFTHSHLTKVLGLNRSTSRFFLGVNFPAGKKFRCAENFSKKFGLSENWSSWLLAADSSWDSNPSPS